ncbi:hypothetical protein D3C77_211140 [compost metagenome]
MHHVARRQLAAAQAGIGEQGAGAAFDVDPAVGTGCAAVVRQGVKLLLALEQELAEGLEARCALLEVHRHQFGDAALAGMGDGFGEVQHFFMGARQRLAVDRAAQRLGAVLADPAAADEALQGGVVAHQKFSRVSGAAGARGAGCKSYQRARE